MSDDQQDETLRRQFQQLQEQQQRRLQREQHQRNARTLKQDSDSDTQAFSFGVTDDLALKVRQSVQNLHANFVGK